jgi:hypothetical protein
LVSFDANGSNVQVCRQSSQGVEDAFYCPVDDSVAWDRGTLLPVLSKMFSPVAVATVLAHEIGHAVQYRLGGVNQATQPIVQEQQADCYTGSFIRWVADGHARHFQISTGAGLNAVLATLMFIRDQVGTTTVDPQAYGSSFDRVTAFQFGFADGPVRCAKIDSAEIRQRVTELGFTAESAAGDNVPVSDATLVLLAQSLNATFTAFKQPPPFVNRPARPAGPRRPRRSACRTTRSRSTRPR